MVVIGIVLLIGMFVFALVYLINTQMNVAKHVVRGSHAFQGAEAGLEFVVSRFKYNTGPIPEIYQPTQPESWWYGLPLSPEPVKFKTGKPLEEPQPPIVVKPFEILPGYSPRHTFLTYKVIVSGRWGNTPNVEYKGVEAGIRLGPVPYGTQY